MGGGTAIAWRPTPSPHRARSIPAWAGEPGLPTIPAAATWVYPRVGGGTLLNNGDHELSLGLSPRGRGNRRCRTSAGRGVGSIPAWAGEPIQVLGTTNPEEVYPRVGGGTATAYAAIMSSSGLSPRGRGNQRIPHTIGQGARSIPAWAGEPVATRT